jgi:hypothetical protein
MPNKILAVPSLPFFVSTVHAMIKSIFLFRKNTNGWFDCSIYIQAWHLWREGKAVELLDPSLAESCSPDEALLCIHVGLLCVQDDPNRRPIMSSVVSILENGSASATASLWLPMPTQPAYLGMMGETAELENSRNTMAMTVIQGR